MQEAVRVAVDAAQHGIWTSMPGIIQSFDPVAMTCVVVVALKEKVLIEQSVQDVEIFPLYDCPVHFPAGGGVSMTFPIKPGDECLVSIANRCIDAWWERGGIQVQQEFRMHDLSDGFVIPKVWSQPLRLPAVSTDSAQMRTTDGKNYVELKEDGNVNVVTTQNVTITAAINVTVNCLNAAVNAQENVTVNAGLDIDLEASRDITIHAQRDIDITAGRNFITNGGDGESGSWTVNVKGPISVTSDTAISHTAPTISEN